VREGEGPGPQIFWPITAPVIGPYQKCRILCFARLFVTAAADPICKVVLVE